MISIAQPIFGEAEKQALCDVLDSNILVQGPQVAKFEQGFSDFTGTKFGIAASSGTTALAICFILSDFPIV